ncbi:hypothetical protein EMIT07CA2_550086 [Brevibacillus sp. IT-7CA2]
MMEVILNTNSLDSYQGGSGENPLPLMYKLIQAEYMYTIYHYIRRLLYS